MIAALSAAAGLLAVVSLPYWLPRLVVALRIRLFTAINGDEGVAIPGALVPASRFKQVYAHPAADGRSRGAKLSDLFWYWLSPGPEVHQEHLEAGARYDEVARATRRVLSISKRATEELVVQAMRRVFAERPFLAASVTRLRRLMMPIWADFYYELVFGERCPARARELIVDNADDVVSALKCCTLRHMSRRNRLTRYLSDKLRAGEVPCASPECLSLEERALYLQGVFFNTAVVQMSEAMTHLVLVIAENEPIQSRLVHDHEDDGYLERLITEVLRVYPLFGVSHRIASAKIALPGLEIAQGSVLCFNHGEFHRYGFEMPERLEPDRWRGLSMRDASYIPFGVAGNRPCPAQAVALTSMRVATRELLRRFRVATSVRHTRAIANAGPCLLVPRGVEYSRRREALVLAWLRFRDRWEEVGRSIVQLVLGTYMVWDARRSRVCERYFREHDEAAGSAGDTGRRGAAT